MTTAIIIKRNLQSIITNIWNTRTPEDYSEYYSKVKASFEAQWIHERTIVRKQMNSLEEMMEKATEAWTSFDVADNNDYFEDAINRLSWEQFLSTLPEKDQMIIRLKKEGYTDQEIADKVGFKTHSAVVKRIKRIAQLLGDYSKEEHKEYCKTFE